MVATGGSEGPIFGLLGVRINQSKEGTEDCAPVGNLLAVANTEGLSVLACEMIHRAVLSHHLAEVMQANYGSNEYTFIFTSKILENIHLISTPTNALT